MSKIVSKLFNGFLVKSLILFFSVFLHCCLIVFGFSVDDFTKKPNKLVSKTNPDPDIISLAGTWKFRLDADNEGINQNWFATDFADEYLRVEEEKQFLFSLLKYVASEKFSPDHEIDMEVLKDLLASSKK